MMMRVDRPTATMARFVAASSGDPPISFTQEGVGAAGRDGRFTEHAGQVAVAVASAAVTFLAAGGFADSRRELRPGHQVRRGREPGHVHPDLGDDRVRRGEPYPVISSSRVTAAAKGAICSLMRACTVAISALMASTLASMVANRKA